MSALFGFDAFSPGEIAERVETIGVTKVRLPLLSMVMLGVLAGGFIGLGALYFVLVVSDPSLGFAAATGGRSCLFPGVDPGGCRGSGAVHRQ